MEPNKPFSLVEIKKPEFCISVKTDNEPEIYEQVIEKVSRHKSLSKTNCFVLNNGELKGVESNLEGHTNNIVIDGSYRVAVMVKGKGNLIYGVFPHEDMWAMPSYARDFMANGITANINSTLFVVQQSSLYLNKLNSPEYISKISLEQKQIKVQEEKIILSLNIQYLMDQYISAKTLFDSIDQGPFIKNTLIEDEWNKIKSAIEQEKRILG